MTCTARRSNSHTAGVGSEAATDRMAEAFALVAEQNARNKLRIEKLLADEAAAAAKSV